MGNKKDDDDGEERDFEDAMRLGEASRNKDADAAAKVIDERKRDGLAT